MVFGRAQIINNNKYLFHAIFLKIICFRGKKTCQTAGVLIISSAVGICAACAEVTGRQQESRGESTD